MIPDIPYRFSVRTLPAEDGGGYWVEFADIRGVHGDGDTIEEAITSAHEALEACLEVARAEGWDVPEPAPVVRAA